ncbi:MAG: hypothetical protein ACREOH_16835 [Candidatus Entotheonellia bacterium]
MKIAKSGSVMFVVLVAICSSIVSAETNFDGTYRGRFVRDGSLRGSDMILSINRINGKNEILLTFLNIERPGQSISTAPVSTSDIFDVREEGNLLFFSTMRANQKRDYRLTLDGDNLTGNITGRDKAAVTLKKIFGKGCPIADAGVGILVPC